jgi:Vault protein inter-alpha-trypsin domain
MSTLQAKLSAVKFEPVVDNRIRTPGGALLIFGVIYPAGVIALEVVSHMCADAFFDPMPTWWHVLAAALVPASNLLVWTYLQNTGARCHPGMAFANGVAIAIAGFYALLFLPLLPLALLAIIVLVGFAPLAPLSSLICALRLWAVLHDRPKDRSSWAPLVGGVAAGLAALIVLDLPGAATRHGIQLASSSEPAERERGLALLRRFGDDDLLLRLCYGVGGRPSGLLSALVLFNGNDIWRSPRQDSIAASPAQAREIYYRMHGVPFNARPAPFGTSSPARVAEFQFDDDHGGTQVGGRLKGLHMVSSRIDGSISGDDAVAYLEWTVEFRNTDWTDREARLQLALPPGGVVSRATLWVNGEEREAAYGERSAVRAAYQRVAVQQRRDPLLVTTKGADRVMAQAFPVPRSGGTIKFKIGITAPLEITDPSKARLTLPAIVDRNFSFASDTTHSVWIEGKQALSASAAGLTASGAGPKLFRIAGALADRDLARTRPAITVDRSSDAVSRVARLGEGEPVVQEIVRKGVQAPPTMMLVIDGSAALAEQIDKLIAALDAIAPATKVGVIIASEPPRQVALAPWSDPQKRAVTKLLRSGAFAGGRDNAPALVEALQALEAEPNAMLVWIHGPQPISFSGSAARLEQAAVRLARLPSLAFYSVEPGPNEVLPDAPWAWSAHSLPSSGALDADVSAYFRRVSGQAPAFAIRRVQGQPTEGHTQGSDHIARLWASERVLELMRASPAGNRDDAVGLASQYRLVTPVSGAVVLETKQQYGESRLTPVDQATVPTVPEPHEWALLLIACAGLSWWAWRNRRLLTTAAAAA